jgi:Strictosidine synthase
MILDPLLDLFRGKAVTIPPMDGALRPNTALDDAKIITSCEAPDNITLVADKLFYSSGDKLFTIASDNPVASLTSAITAIAASGTTLAIGLESGRIEFFKNKAAALEGFNCPAALAFDGPEDLYICNGSDTHSPGEWATDLMQKNSSGSLWHVSLATGERRCLAKGLAFPYGLIVDAKNNRVVISESWKHRLISIPLQGGKPTVVLPNLAGYPARLIATSSGGYVLSLFAPRNRLIEFVLLEDDFRNAMLSEIDSRYWIAPALSASRSFLEPLQSGGVKTMGIHKPWSPSRSYGLVAVLDENFEPVTSYHSRANGTRHGITSAIEHRGKIIATSRGGNVILEVTPEKEMT